ncbi:hypothetical protein TSTA_104710 [Talaromyces stipitatus ATCC 10500]|uniref:Uncharacterized protein n=1 Tax=Talaromyces stipitatus (strain ATCC 10500 / CBS 375.48 / QM 6759 / NRRL 1006) TaxID=441959 RepID=B8MP18_TALSN|nr:uncharacterized protein TSTA_104710 [Talaromyces stipitatus ATCC 10500]EED14257.1 hypothetical protein TSTA_104710 [Talaromyces stipitatus ATCC 10500]
MWKSNNPFIASSCTQVNQPKPSDEEITNLHDAIQQVASETLVDRRFILAIILQESKGCLRVPTTSWGVSNPGLMQDHGGTGTCYGVNSYPKENIVQMVQDGTSGTKGGDGLVTLLDKGVTPCYASDIANRLTGWVSAEYACTF